MTKHDPEDVVPGELTLSPDDVERLAFPMTFAAYLDAELENIRDLLLAKRHDYGPGNLPEFGEYGILVRASDKFERLKNLSRGAEAPRFEAIEDTWRDIAGYALLALMMRAAGGPEEFGRLETK
jgi:hypothetical protein